MMRHARSGNEPRDVRFLMKWLGRLVGYMGPIRRELAAGMVCTVIGTALSLLGPQYIAKLTDEIASSISGGVPADMHAVLGFGLTAAVLYILSMAFRSAESYLVPASSEKVAYRLRRDLSEKLDILPVSRLDESKTGDLMSRMTNDCETIGTLCGDSIDMLVMGVMLLFGSLAMMLYTDWKLALFAVLPTAAGFVALYVITKRTHKYYRAQTRDLGRMNALIEEVYYGHDIVSIYNDRGNTGRKFDEINGSLFDSAFKARAVTAVMPQMMNLLSNLGYVIVCVAGSMMIVDGSIEYGSIAAFLIYIRRLNQPIGQLSEAVNVMQSVTSSAERVFEVLDWPEIGCTEDNPDFRFEEGHVEFRDVRFSYSEGKEVIHGLRLDIPGGSKVAIVGPTGAGKTTVANLLLRFNEVDSGEILIDGTPLSSLSHRQVHGLFSMVLQDSWLFDGSIRDNIAFTERDAGDDAIDRACSAAGIKPFIDSLPDGYGTMLSDVSGLSIGQRQQISIARAMVKDAPMILLDEATSSVDTKTERHIQAAMDRLMEGRTSFVIAHRLSTIVSSDLILVLKDGDVIESGTHRELIDRNGFYRMLFDSQFENCE